MREASTKHVKEYVVTVWWLIGDLPFERLRPNPMAEARMTEMVWYNDQKDRHHESEAWWSALSEGVMPLKGKRKIRDKWEEETCEVVHQIATDIPSYKVTDQCRWSCILHQNWLLLITSEIGIPLCIGSLSCTGQMYQPHPMQANFQRKWKSIMMPQQE